MMSALAYLAMLFIKIPIADFLKYDPKDVIITVLGFIYGPLTALITAFVVCLLEAITVGTTGIIGAAMNFIASAGFACVAAFIYKKKRTLGGAALGLICGVFSMTVLMLLWNYFLTPIYMGYPREAVAAMLPTLFLPFNLVKGGINAAITMLLYKPVVISLRKADLIPASVGGGAAGEDGGYGTINVAAIMLSVAVLAISVFGALKLSGAI